MMGRVIKNEVIVILSLIAFLMVLPQLSYAKRARPSKPAKPPEASAQPSAKSQPPKKGEAPLTVESSLQCDAQSAVLMDGLTGQVLYEQNPQLRIPPASFVKILTLYVAYDAIRAGQLKLDDMVTVSEKAWRTQGSKMFIKVGDRVKVGDLLKGIAIASGNDACIALSEHLSGSEDVFVTKMNEKARLLGMKDSQFKNSDGMPAEGQYTSALDMAILSKRYIEDHPEALALHSSTEFEYNGIRQGNRNTLLQKNIGVDGLKTGHIEQSGYHLVATAKREGQRMIAVVMGCEKVRKRAPEAQKLLEYGFKNFLTLEAVKKGTTFGPVKVKRGKLNQVMLAALEDVRVTVARGKEKAVSVTPQLPEFVVAPIQKGQILAKVTVQNEGKLVKEASLLASTEVPKSLLPSWPVLAGGLGGLCLVSLAGLWFFRRQQRKKFA